MLTTKANLSLALIAIAHISLAQTRDSIPKKVIAFVADKFPATRILNVEYTQLAPYHFSPELNGNDLPENKVTDFHQLKANVNMYFLRKKKWVFGTSLNYRYISIQTDAPISLFPGAIQNKTNFHYHTEAVHFTYFSRVFNKTAIFTATASVDGSEQHFERVRGTISGTLVLKANAKTKLSLGLIALIDPSTQIPVLPIFAYEHKFDNGWVADVILPKKIMMRKDIFGDGRLSIGADLDNTTLYMYHAKKTYEFRQLDVNSGLMYEHCLGAFIASVKSGVRISPNSRVFEKSDSPKDYFFDANPKPAFYFNVGVSYNPFANVKK